MDKIHLPARSRTVPRAREAIRVSSNETSAFRHSTVFSASTLYHVTTAVYIHAPFPPIGSSAVSSTRIPTEKVPATFSPREFFLFLSPSFLRVRAPFALRVSVPHALFLSFRRDLSGDHLYLIFRLFLSPNTERSKKKVKFVRYREICVRKAVWHVCVCCSIVRARIAIIAALSPWRSFHNSFICIIISGVFIFMCVCDVCSCVCVVLCGLLPEVLLLLWLLSMRCVCRCVCALSWQKRFSYNKQNLWKWLILCYDLCYMYNFVYKYLHVSSSLLSGRVFYGCYWRHAQCHCAIFIMVAPCLFSFLNVYQLLYLVSSRRTSCWR